MSILSGKNVLLGVCGGIAAYKTPILVRLLIKIGAKVKVIMTPSAKEFVTPLTLSTLTNYPVFDQFISNDDQNPLWNNHVDMAIWADLMIIAPATSNIISLMANAESKNLLVATYLSSKCQIYIAPAMDLDMFNHPATKKNIKKLKSFGNYVLPSPEGFLASGLKGKGRMMEPEGIILYIENNIIRKLPLYKKKVLITAGPTHEYIDPVRFIGNNSSGLMGYELAKASLELGAEVFLISGPTHLKIKNDNLNLINVVSAEEMFKKVKSKFNSVDIVISAAAIADFTPIKKHRKKIKKNKGLGNIELKETKDILYKLGKLKKQQILVGFALETDNEINNAKAKLVSKKLDIIVLNSLNDENAGFGKMNKVTIISKNSDPIFYELKEKKKVARDIMNNILIYSEKKV